jgi:hypothetical protein
MSTTKKGVKSIFGSGFKRPFGFWFGDVPFCPAVNAEFVGYEF